MIEMKNYVYTLTLNRESSPSPSLESRSVSICSFSSDTLRPSVSLSSHTQDGDGVKVKQSNVYFGWSVCLLSSSGVLHFQPSSGWTEHVWSTFIGTCTLITKES